MSRLALTLACGNYDRTVDLRTGDVTVEGVDLNYLAFESVREIFDRMGGSAEFDAAEFSSSEYISRVDAGDRTFVAIPVFPSKLFRHGYIYVNRRSGIRTPKDLEGKRVGMGLYTQTAAVWIRGHLQHQFGVNLANIHWVQGAIEKAGGHGNPSAPPLLAPVEIENNTSGRSLSELLAEGRIDAIAGARRPTVAHPDVVPLFPDARAVEIDFYRSTRIHPIMHLVVIRRDVYERNSWVAASLYKAFNQAKDSALARLHRTTAHVVMLPWYEEEMKEIEAVFGRDHWPYGVEANRPTLEALVQYMQEQHLIRRVMPVDELFVPIKGASAS